MSRSDERGWLQLDLLEDKNGPYLKGQDCRLYVSGTVQNTATLKPRANQMGRSRRTSPNDYSNEHHSKCTSRSGFVPLQSCMGWIIKPYMHQADPIAQNLAQTRLRTKHFMEGEHRNFASAHRGATTAERSLWWIRHGRYGCSSSLELSPCQCQHRRGILS